MTKKWKIFSCDTFRPLRLHLLTFYVDEASLHVHEWEILNLIWLYINNFFLFGGICSRFLFLSFSKKIYWWLRAFSTHETGYRGQSCVRRISLYDKKKKKNYTRRISRPRCVVTHNSICHCSFNKNKIKKRL